MIYHESREQQDFFRRANLRRYLSGTLRDYVYAVPNGGTTGGRRALIAGIRRRAEGLTEGVPDIECMVAVAPYTGLHIEMKKSKKDGGKPSDVAPKQKDMMARLTKCGRKCTVAFGADEAWAQLLEYLKL
jgi:hypothetical protein